MARVTIRHGGFLPQAVHAAALLREELGVDADVRRGKPWEFSVWVDGRKVVSRGILLFPTDRKIVAAVRAALFYA